VFEAVLSVVAEKIPVVCAAGNDGLDALTWPAAEATDANGIIAVGAVTYLARRSSYSNYAKPNSSERVTLVAPSDDAEVYTRTQVRLDAESPDWRRHNHYFDANGLGIEVPFSPQSLVTTDIPGPSGYVGGYVEGANSGRGAEDRASLYALFGGTSGASAIVAGAVALLQAQQGGAALDGPGVKAKVNGAVATVVSWPWLAASVTLQGDAMNGEKDDPTLESRQFGKGVLDLDKLLS
jgi:subtilisin family serine protease